MFTDEGYWYSNHHQLREETELPRETDADFPREATDFPEGQR